MHSLGWGDFKTLYLHNLLHDQIEGVAYHHILNLCMLHYKPFIHAKIIYVIAYPRYVMFYLPNYLGLEHIL